MKFNIPLDKDFKFKIGCHIFDIKFVHNNIIEQKSKAKKDEYIYGVWRPDENIVYISKELSNSLKLSTIFHEIMHVVETIYDLRLSHQNVNIIGEALAQMFIETLQVKK